MTDIKKESCVAELLVLHQAGAAVDNVVRIAYAQGRLDGLLEAFRINAKVPQTDPEFTEHEKAALKYGLQEMLERQTGCYDGPESGSHDES